MHSRQRGGERPEPPGFRSAQTPAVDLVIHEPAAGSLWTGFGTYDLAAVPSPAVQAKGIGGRGHGQYDLERRHGGPMTTPQDPDAARRPPYRVPLMSEIRGIPWNGYNVISTFAASGGSSTGYRIEGFRVLVAVEWIAKACESYRANKAEYTHVVNDDVRNVTGAQLLKLAGLKVGELDLFDGSPPCEPFSTAGRRDETWGDGRDDLFFDYARLIREMRPRTFVAENVAGLIRGKAKGYFKLIHKELVDCGYRVEARLLDAQWLGVPQTRQRVIFVGVREDLVDRDTGEPLMPAFPDPLPYRYRVRDALPHLFEPAGGTVVRDTNGNDSPRKDLADGPASAVTASNGAAHLHTERQPLDLEGRETTDQTVVHDPAMNGGNRRAVGDLADLPAPAIMASPETSRQQQVVRESRVVHDPAGHHNANRPGKGVIDDLPAPCVLARDMGHDTQIEQRVVHDVDHGAMESQGDVTDRPHPTILARRQQTDETQVERTQTGEPRYIHDTHGQFPGRGDVTDKVAPTVQTTAGGQHHIERDVRVMDAESGGRFADVGEVTDRPAATVTAQQAKKGKGPTVEQETRVVHDPGENGSMRRPQGDVTDRPHPAVVASSRGRDSTVDRAFSGRFDKFDTPDTVTDQPMPCITAGEQRHQGFERLRAPDDVPADGDPGAWREIRREPDGTVVERRKLTIGELRRICAFPDDFVLVGSYSVQWERLGDAVPPVMMSHIAAAVRDRILERADGGRVDTIGGPDAT